MDAGWRKGWEAERLGGWEAVKLGGWEAVKLGGWEAERPGGDGAEGQMFAVLEVWRKPIMHSKEKSWQE